MAPKLGHDSASIQRITQYHAYLDTNEALYSSVRQMLVDWFKAAEKSKDKVTTESGLARQINNHYIIGFNLQQAITTV